MVSPVPSGPEGNPIARPNRFTPEQKHIQQILAVTFASISILSAVVTIYWFVNLKKLYRHHLIILLIAGDAFKVTWYLIPAFVILDRKRPISIDFCKVAGFFLSAGVEATDFAILLIALHTALAIFRPGRSQGLYLYRYWAYACWVAFGVLLPGLAFVNPIKDQSYISQGTYCFLPVRPIWYRLALSWVPRYLILCTIGVVYLTIYVYTVMQFGKFNVKISDSTMSTVSEAPDHVDGPSPDPERISRRTHSAGGTQEEPHTAPGNAHKSIRGMSGSPSSPSPARVFRKPTLLEALHDKNLIPFQITELSKDASPTLRKRHKAIKRQLRYMFIYPLVYLLMWIAPFINHCYFYTKQHNPPFILNSIALVSLCLQCAVDCLIFCIRERPWRYAKNGRGIPRSRQSSAGAGSEVEMAGFAGRNRRTDDARPSSEQAGARNSREQAGRQPPGRNWFDNEGI